MISTILRFAFDGTIRYVYCETSEVDLFQNGAVQGGLNNKFNLQPLPRSFGPQPSTLMLQNLTNLTINYLHEHR